MNGAASIFLKLAKEGLIKRKKINDKNKDETSLFTKHVQNVIKNKKNRAKLLLDKFNKTNNLDFF